MLSVSDHKNFHEFFAKHASVFGDAPCVTDGERGAVYSYKEVNDLVNRAAAYLSEMGIQKGDRFATLTRNCPEFLFLYLASMKLGTLIVPLEADLPFAGIIAVVKRFGIKALFYNGEREQILPRMFPIQSLLPEISKRAVDENLFSGVKLEDPGSLYFSSGTTGTPKGIPQSPKNLLTAAAGLLEVYGFTSNDTQMGVLPCYHTALATYGFWPSIWVGGNFVLFEKFSKSNFWKNLAKHKISFVEVVPTILTMLLNPPENISGYDLSRLKFIGSGSAPLPIPLHHQFEKVFAVAVANQYGLSETAPTHFNFPDKSKSKEGSIGKPIPMCEAKIVIDGGQEAAVGEIGEIVIRGDSVVRGYYNNPEETEASFRNGWFHTGDLGHKDADGFYFFAGRKKEMINRGGEKIYPQEVDAVLLSFPSVREAATVGEPDSVYGERVVAYLVSSESGASIQEKIIQHCRERLPAYKCPEKIFFIDEIPKTPSGKIMRRVLTERQ